MSTPLTWPGGLANPAARPVTLLALGWRAMTWKHACYTFLLCTAWSLIEVVSATSNFSRPVLWSPALNSFLSMQLNGFAVMFAVLIADGASPAPLRRWWPYVLAVVVAVALATTLFWFVSQRVFTIPSAIQLRGLPEGFDTIVFRHSTSRLAICGLAAYVYVCWRFAGQRLVALRAVQLERAAAEKRVLEARLAFTESRVEPQFLSNTLMQIERLYELDAPAADRVLKELILYLRAAIPQIDNPASTVAREFQLTNAYLNIVGLQSKSRLVFQDDSAAIGIGTRMPPMVLLPLINHALAHRPERALGDERFWIDVGVHNEKVLLTIRDQGSGFASEGASDTQIVRIRELLVALYGDSARLTLKEAVGGTEAVIEIPYEFVGSDALA